MNQQVPHYLQFSLTVSRKEIITPHYIRIYLTGKDVNRLHHITPGVNNKILIPPKGLNVVHFPEFDDEKKQWKPMPEALRPVIRTYTHRGIDLKKSEIWIDFVAHGDQGPASAWAISAEPGDVLGIILKNEETVLFPPADHYLLIGDATAIPVLGVILENLPPHARGTCILEVQDKEDEQQLPTLANIHFSWLHNPNPEKGSRLVEILKRQKLPQQQRFAYVAAEFSTVKEIRRYLRKEQDWKKEELYAYSYWKAGVTEDHSAMERHHENEEAARV